MNEELMKRLRATYPKRDGGHGWGVVPRLIEKAVANGADVERIELGTKNYAIHCQKKGMVGTEYVQQARTFYGPGNWWDEWADQDMRSPREIAQEREWGDLESRARKLGFTTVDRSKGIEVARYAIESEERKAKLSVVK